MKARFLKSIKVQELMSKISENLELYRNGNFDFMTNDPAHYFETDLDIQEDTLSAISCDKDDPKEVECCIQMYQALGAVSHYLARDERLWVYLSHTFLLGYARTRWPIPADDEEATKHIKAHFFCVGARGVERDNVASRLWWMASLCNRTADITLEDALTCFLHQSDVRANIVERPTTSQNVRVFSAVLKKLNESYNSDKSLFNRERFRSVMKGLNIRGGVKLLGALSETRIMHILEECIAQTD
ncbi:MAG: DUF6339 family protein [Deltaproteobacteria bacterium]|nr:DUF6339 family protein [Deltaproteobacteria bacterium]